MRNRIKQRTLLTAQVSILIAQIIGIGFVIGHASEGHAGERQAGAQSDWLAASIADPAAYRDDVRASARIAVWKTRFAAMSDLELKLDNKQASNVRLAGNLTDDRG